MKDEAVPDGSGTARLAEEDHSPDFWLQDVFSACRVWGHSDLKGALAAHGMHSEFGSLMLPWI